MESIKEELKHINDSLININASLNKPKKTDYLAAFAWIIAGILILCLIYYAYYKMSNLYGSSF